MQLTLLKGYPDFVGKRATFVGWGNGPASYNATTGDVLTLPMPNYYIDAVPSRADTLSSNFFVKIIPSGVGPRQKWALFWFTAAGAVASGNLSAEQLQIGGWCGQY